jgi:hypothetical protein
MVQALQIDFVRRRRLASPLGWLLLLVGLIGLGGVVLDYTQAQDELLAVQARSQRQARIDKPAPARRPAAPMNPESSNAAVHASAALTQPWDGLLRELESLNEPRVALLSLDAKAEARTLRVTGEANAMADVVAYIKRLRPSPLTRSAALVTHEIRRDGQVDVIRFSLDVIWKLPA